MNRKHKITLAVAVTIALTALLFTPILTVEGLTFAGETDIPDTFNFIALIGYSDIAFSDASFTIDQYTFECKTVKSNYVSGETVENTTVHKLNLELENVNVKTDSFNVVVGRLTLSLYLQYDTDKMQYYVDSTTQTSIADWITTAASNMEGLIQ
ncbi:MAG: hypothetical protein WC325_11920 [Candidatus Bathyarchaeia archaeon]